MFIRNCPDPELSLIFKCKPLHEWTAADVQVRLDEYQREDKFQQRKSNAYVSGTACHAQSMDILCAHSRGLETAAVGVPPPQVTEQSTPDQSLSRVISLLERVLDQGSCQQTARVFRPQHKGRSAVPKQNAACKLCGDASHDTFSHCRINHLCFNCHASGHRASVCSAGTANKPQVQQSSPDSDHLGN